jgi:hypothetical protein
LDRLRGLGIRSLLEPKRQNEQQVDVRSLAFELGLLTQDRQGLSPSPAIGSIPKGDSRRSRQGQSTDRVQRPSTPGVPRRPRG